MTNDLYAYNCVNLISDSRQPQASSCSFLHHSFSYFRRFQNFDRPYLFLGICGGYICMYHGNCRIDCMQTCRSCLRKKQYHLRRLRPAGRKYFVVKQEVRELWSDTTVLEEQSLIPIRKSRARYVLFLYLSLSTNGGIIIACVNLGTLKSCSEAAMPINVLNTKV